MGKCWYTAGLGILLFLNANSLVLGEEAAEPPENGHLKGLAFLIGTWEAEMVADEDGAGGFIKKGDKISLKLDCDWKLNKKLIDVEIHFLLNGSLLEATVSHIGWDAEKKSVVSFAFNSNGGRAADVWSQKDGNWILDIRAVDAAGSIETRTMTISEIEENAFCSQTTDKKVDGEERPDGKKIAWTRVK